MKTKRAVIIQCRLSSTRFKEKALKKIGDKTILEWSMLSMSKVPADRYFVATDEQSYPILKSICEKNNYECFAGDLNNVLKRYCDLIRKINVDTVIRATADNPFLIYEAAVDSLNEFEKLNKEKIPCEYFTYSGLPHGCGVEIFNAQSLLMAQTTTVLPFDLEHVGPALYNHQDKYKCIFKKAPERFNHPDLRTTVDTYTDYLRCICAYNNLENKKGPFTCEQIISTFNSINVFVFIPSVVKGRGTGHLRRCLDLAVQTKGFVYIPDDYTLTETDSLIIEYEKKGLNRNQIINILPDENLSAIYVTDLFKATEKDYEILKKGRFVISLDEGSSLNYKSDYLLNIIPSLDDKNPVNKTESGFIEKPVNVRKNNNQIKNVLICFGGEDPCKMGEPVKEIITKILPESQITLVEKPVENLKEKLADYDLIITHYGLTAFESLYANCAIILCSPTKLHEELAKKYNFAYVGYNNICEENFKNALNNENLFPKRILNDSEENLFEYLQFISKGHKYNCPVCQKENDDEIISRNETRTYRRCKSCGLIYISFSCDKEKEYKKEYFFEDYKKQYGKTYQEDFESIKKQGLKRAAVIKNIYKSKNNNLLDIGCAYGPFLKAADELGFTPYGTDISKDAVDYVKKQLRYPCTTSAFPEINVDKEFGISKFNICTMWYVIEHFNNLNLVLEKVSSLVQKDGIFAFSTPSAKGISAKSNKDNFYKISPTDHFSVWEPDGANKILKKFGFKVIKIVSTGHHPERFPFVKKHNIQKGSFMWKIIDLISHIFSLGDTVEIYCKKIN